MKTLSRRARYVIELLNDPDREIWRDRHGRSHTVREICPRGANEWFMLGYSIPNIGPKTIAELVIAGVIEMKPDVRGEPRVYRLVDHEAEQDFGDLWVPA
jgi:hypothetical protein